MSRAATPNTLELSPEMLAAFSMIEVHLPSGWRWMSLVDLRSRSGNLVVDHLVRSERVGQENRWERVCGMPARRYISLRAGYVCCRCLEAVIL